MHFQPHHATMEARLPLQYSHQVLKTETIISSYFETIKPILQKCQEHCNKIVRRQRFRSIRRAKACSKSKKGRGICKHHHHFLYVFVMLLWAQGLLYHANYNQTQLLYYWWPSKVWETGKDRDTQGQQPSFYPSMTWGLVGWCVLLVRLCDINSAQGSWYKCMWLYKAGPLCLHRLLL